MGGEKDGQVVVGACGWAILSPLTGRWDKAPLGNTLLAHTVVPGEAGSDPTLATLLVSQAIVTGTTLPCHHLFKSFQHILAEATGCLGPTKPTETQKV